MTQFPQIKIDLRIGDKGVPFSKGNLIDILIIIYGDSLLGVLDLRAQLWHGQLPQQFPTTDTNKSDSLGDETKKGNYMLLGESITYYFRTHKTTT